MGGKIWSQCEKEKRREEKRREEREEREREREMHKGKDRHIDDVASIVISVKIQAYRSCAFVPFPAAMKRRSRFTSSLIFGGGLERSDV